MSLYEHIIALIKSGILEPKFIITNPIICSLKFNLTLMHINTSINYLIIWLYINNVKINNTIDSKINIGFINYIEIDFLECCFELLISFRVYSILSKGNINLKTYSIVLYIL